jgi:hypothetical protein
MGLEGVEVAELGGGMLALVALGIWEGVQWVWFKVGQRHKTIASWDEMSLNWKRGLFGIEFEGRTIEERLSIEAEASKWIKYTRKINNAIVEHCVKVGSALDYRE